MIFFNYLSYFFYLGFNWNWKIAFTIISQEIKGEKKYGIQTTGADELKNLKKTGVDISHATIYMPVSYQLLEIIFNNLPVHNRHHFLDIGCGKGRAICVAAHNGFKKITGIDFSEKFCEAATKNFALTQSKTKHTTCIIVHKNILDYAIPNDVSCIFLFNPFDDEVMKVVVENITISLQQQPRKVYIVYVNPLYKYFFTHAGFAEIFYSKQKKYFEVSVLVN
jgi:SAM-dependent methyltransferase